MWHAMPLVLGFFGHCDGPVPGDLTVSSARMPVLVSCLACHSESLLCLLFLLKISGSGGCQWAVDTKPARIHHLPTRRCFEVTLDEKDATWKSKQLTFAFTEGFLPAPCIAPASLPATIRCLLALSVSVSTPHLRVPAPLFSIPISFLFLSALGVWMGLGSIAGLLLKIAVRGSMGHGRGWTPGGGLCKEEDIRRTLVWLDPGMGSKPVLS